MLAQREHCRFDAMRGQILNTILFFFRTYPSMATRRFSLVLRNQLSRHAEALLRMFRERRTVKTSCFDPRYSK